MISCFAKIFIMMFHQISLFISNKGDRGQHISFFFFLRNFLFDYFFHVIWTCVTIAMALVYVLFYLVFLLFDFLLDVWSYVCSFFSSRTINPKVCRSNLSLSLIFGLISLKFFFFFFFCGIIIGSITFWN